jgi:hypothetical protein
MKLRLFSFMVSCTIAVQAQLAVTVSPVKVAGQKAIVPLAMKNNFAEKIESACAAVFLLDEQGKMIGQATKWVIGGSRDKPGLAAGATNAFHFVIAADKPFASTNLTAKVTNRVILSRKLLRNGPIPTLASLARRSVVRRLRRHEKANIRLLLSAAGLCFLGFGAPWQSDTADHGNGLSWFYECRRAS